MNLDLIAGLLATLGFYGCAFGFYLVNKDIKKLKEKVNELTRQQRS